MFSLRKRAKLIGTSEKILENETNFDFLPNFAETYDCKNQLVSFDQLPVEIYYCLFDRSNVESILKIRQLSKRFQNILDNCEYIWKRRIKVKLELNNQRETDELLALLDRCKFIDMVEVASSKYFKTSKFPASMSTNPRPSHSPFTLYLTMLNLYAIDNLTPILVNCSHLCIDSFYAQTQSFKQINQLNYKTSQSTKISLHGLNTFHISCKMYDRKNSRYINIDEINNLQFVFRTFQMDNLRYLKISCYRHSLGDLVSHLKSLKNLTYLEFDECTVDAIPYTYNATATVRIRPKFLHFFSCTIIFCRFILEMLVDLECVEYLSLFDHRDCSDMYFGGANVDDQKGLLNFLDSKMPNLFELKTNFSIYPFRLVNFQFSTLKLFNFFLINRFSKLREQTGLEYLNYSLVKNMKSKFEMELLRLDSNKLNLDRFNYMNVDIFYDFIKKYLITNRICLKLEKFVLELNLNCKLFGANEDQCTFGDCLSLIAKNFANLKLLGLCLRCSNSKCHWIKMNKSNTKFNENQKPCKLEKFCQPKRNYFLKDFCKNEANQYKNRGFNVEFKINFFLI
jgi:hypothetical protein